MKRVTGNRYIGSRSIPIVLLSYTSCRVRLQWGFADLHRKTRCGSEEPTFQEIRRGRRILRQGTMKPKSREKVAGIWQSHAEE